jgi:hypothetical protein
MARGAGISSSLVAVLLALTLMPVHVALAQPADAAADADARFQEGLTLMAAKSFAEACPKFEESHRLAPSAGALLNLADCDEQLGKTASAWAAFRDAAALANALGQAERAAKAERRAAGLEPKLVRVAVVVAAAVPGLVVRRNGAEVAAAGWGAALPVDPGSVTVEASAPGKKAWRTTVEATEAGTTLTVQVPPLADEAPPAPVTQAPVVVASPPAVTETPKRSFWAQHKGSALTLGGGVVLAGIGAGLAAKTLPDHAAWAQMCSMTKCTDADGAGLRREAAAANVLFAAAGVAGATAVVVFFTAEGEKRQASVAVVPMGAGAGVVVRY